jgi:hypothetical protein
MKDDEDILVATITVAQSHSDARIALKTIRAMMEVSPLHEIFIARHVALQPTNASTAWLTKQLLLSGILKRSCLATWFPMTDIVDPVVLQKRFDYLTVSLVPSWFGTVHSLHKTLVGFLEKYGGDNVSWVWCYFAVALHQSCDMVAFPLSAARAQEMVGGTISQLRETAPLIQTFLQNKAYPVDAFILAIQQGAPDEAVATQ